MIPGKSPRVGPRWPEIAVSLACSFLIATDVTIGRNANIPQSGESYYHALPAVKAFQTASVVLDAAVVLVVLAWIFLPKIGGPARGFVRLVSAIGFALAWFEAVWALTRMAGQSFVLNDLPFRPIANSGLIGAQVFATYLFLQLPSGKMTTWQANLVRLGLAVCFWVLQIFVWDGVERFVLARP